MMPDTYEIFKPKGFWEYSSTILMPDNETLIIEGRTDSFDFEVRHKDKVLMRHNEHERYVEIQDRKYPLECKSWQNWSLKFLLDGKQYSHKFIRMDLLHYAMHNVIICDGKEAADIYSTINSQVLFFKTGGYVRMTPRKGANAMELLFYALAWWWSGYYTDSTTS